MLEHSKIEVTSSVWSQEVCTESTRTNKLKMSKLEGKEEISFKPFQDRIFKVNCMIQVVGLIPLSRPFFARKNPISATEYDFVPNRLEVNTQTLVHFQWAGSNTNDKVNYKL